jgi:hypothetical protein
MAATIKIKNSSTASAVPTSSDLVQGELAVNVTDKRIFTENASGTVVELGTNPSILTLPDGSASAPTLTNDGDTNTGIFFPAADTVGITTGGSERLRVDSSGNLGLGVTPSAWTTYTTNFQNTSASVASNGVATTVFGTNWYYDGQNRYRGTGLAALYFQTAGQHAWFTAASGTAGNILSSLTQAMTLDASGNLGIGATSMPAKLTVQTGGRYNLEIQPDASLPYIQAYDRTGGAFTDFAILANNIRLYTGGSERARIDSSGNLLVGKTVTTSTTTGISFAPTGQAIVTSNGSVDAIVGYRKDATTGNNIYAGYSDVGSTLSFRFAVINNGGIQNYSANNTNLSDERVKTNIVLAGDYLAKICAIPVKTFNYKDEPEGEQASLGVIAQDVESVAPELVNTEGFGETPEDGVPLKAIYQTDLQYALMKCIQEQQAIIETLTARITALEQA